MTNHRLLDALEPCYAAQGLHSAALEPEYAAQGLYLLPRGRYYATLGLHSAALRSYYAAQVHMQDMVDGARVPGFTEDG